VAAALPTGRQREPVPPEVLRVVKQVEIKARILADEAMVGVEIAGLTVRHVDELPDVVTGVSIGVIATPAAAAQDVCDRLVAAGVTSILNFAPTVLSVPVHVDLRKVDLSIELQILAYHEQRKSLERTVLGEVAQ